MKNACCTLSFLLFAICTVGPIFGQDSIDYNRDIRPLLADRCYACHGPDESANESGMRLDIESEAIDAGVWVPGKPGQSELIERITADDDSIIMPPRDSNLTPSTKEIDRLEKWVKEGAKVDQHWAFQTLPQHVDVPKISAAEDAEGIANPWARNSIDRFVLSRAHNLRRSGDFAFGPHRFFSFDSRMNVARRFGFCPRSVRELLVLVRKPCKIWKSGEESSLHAIRQKSLFFNDLRR